MNSCDRARIEVEMYSDNFLQTFENSDFFTMCKKTVEGKLQWKEWNHCSVTCGGGFQSKIAIACVPDYAVCYDIPILEQSCNEEACPVQFKSVQFASMHIKKDSIQYNINCI